MERAEEYAHLRENATDAQRDAIDALERNGDDYGLAAEELGVTRSTLRGTMTRARQRAGVSPVVAARHVPQAMRRKVRHPSDRFAQVDSIRERLAETIASAFQFQPVPRIEVPRIKRAPKTERLLTVLVSDVHFGLNVSSVELGSNAYTWEIAARRMALLAKQAAEWKPEKRAETKLNVVINGDVIAGLIHDDDWGLRPLTEQIHGATLILVQWLDFLATQFASIDVTILPGNHDRTTRDRQLAQRWDSYANCIGISLEMAFRSNERITFAQPLGGYAKIALPGAGVMVAAHGDTALTVRNVGKSFSVEKVRHKLNDLIASGFAPGVKLLCFGHWHQPFAMQVNGVYVVVNGSVIGADSYAREGVGIMNGGYPSQWLIESVPGHAMGDSRCVELWQADNDASLDAIIQAPNLEAWA